MRAFGTDRQGRIWGVCLALMTDLFAPQVLSIKADKILNAVTAGHKCSNSLHFPSNVAWYYYETTMLLPCLNCACAMT